MQEPSVSSTTSSPHKQTTIAAEESAKDADLKTNPNLKDTQENPGETCFTQTSLTESRVGHRSRHRTHTCSKSGRRRSRSSDRRSFRKSHNRRRHRRSRRTRSRSRHYSGNRRQHRRRHRRRYSTESSTLSSSYRSSSESRSPSHRSQHRRHASDSSQRTDLPNSRFDQDSSDTHLKAIPQGNKLMSRDVSQVSLSETPKDNTTLTNGLPKLTASNPALNGLVSLLLNTTNSTNSLTDLFGSAIYGMAGNSINPTIATPSSNSTRQARRLYIGSIPLGITSETMVTFFNSELQTRGLCQSVGEPVVCAQVNSERHFAFIELRSVEETTATLSLDGINCLGSTLRIRRPRDYFPPGTNPSVHPVGHLNANAIFLTGIPTNLSEQNLCRLLSAYGTLRSFSMLRDPLTAMPRGCGFFEYTASESADLACLGLQNHPAGGGKFFAIRADYLVATPPLTSLPPLSSSLTTATAAAAVASVAAPQLSPTPVLCLDNMVSPHDIDSPEGYADVMEDVRSECLRHGAVISVHIPQPKSSTSLTSTTTASSTKNLGKIFVEFATAQQAHTASVALDGRKYNGRTVCTSFCDPARYAAGEFS
ncbi:Splicing factor U2AF 65 kDa subunit [Echinococcus granulosus]|uniref:U2 small nuclear ribonucleoprotein n=1 Tax=Echinococcus granulosus TaxID=6210 RepID=A0A068WZ16_ECHGR|nr:Splicing factor U2AF 65 kDa subunit [Echinococcus granulosus]CDS22897.1 U2 small nuclear ribonucleoprotein [Echinococcus granulosus]